MAESKVTMFDNDDPEMQAAYEEARALFRYCWREIANDRRRIIPALGMAAVKAPFHDPKLKKRNKPDTEHMWLMDIDFDGQEIIGTVGNSPNWLTNVEQGDEARFKVDEISDWMYVISGTVYGAFTVNVLRSRMKKKERREHDEAWGLDFGEPNETNLTPNDHDEFNINSAKVLKDALKENPEIATEPNENGWTALHHEALAGNPETVKVLLAAGADASLKTDHGMTPLQLAQALGWEDVITVLTTGTPPKKKWRP